MGGLWQRRQGSNTQSSASVNLSAVEGLGPNPREQGRPQKAGSMSWVLAGRNHSTGLRNKVFSREMRGRKNCKGKGTEVGTWNRRYDERVTGATRAAAGKASYGEGQLE